MIDKKSRRTHRAQKTRQRIRTQADRPRLTVNISGQHIYAQVFSSDGSKVLASASTLDKQTKTGLTKKGVNKENATIIGQTIAKRAIDAGIDKVAFDRSGFKYHGRIKALADAAREGNLIF